MTRALTRPIVAGALSSHRLAAVAAGALTGTAALGYVGLQDPHAGGVLPRCPWHWATGLDCPGCGGLRMTHDLLHGDVARAFGDNAILLLLTPLLLFLLARGTVRWLRGDAPARRGRFKVRGALSVTLAVVGISWGVLRNLG